MEQVSTFTNLTTPSVTNTTIEGIIKIIRTSDDLMKRITGLRKLYEAGEKSEYAAKKKSLPAFTPCGVFKERRVRDMLKTYSRLVILDIDKQSPEELALLKQTAVEIKYTQALFVSPGGNGLKILVKVNTGSEHHLTAFNQVKNYYERILKVKIDPTGKDLARLCFLSWDPDAFYRKTAVVFIVNTNLSLEQDIERIVEQIDRRRLDITSDYTSWRNAGFALADALGESGRGYFHRISCFNPDYNHEFCDEQYSKCLNSNGAGITIRTFFYMAKSNGISLKTIERKYPEYFKDDPNDEMPEDVIEEKKESKVKGNKFLLAMNYIGENYDVRYNIISSEFEYKSKDETLYRPLNENDIFIKMQLDGLSISLNNLIALLKSEFVEKFNPFEHYFGSLPEWDGEKDYINHLASFVIVNETERRRFNVHFKKWLVRAVKCSLVDSYFNKQAFILVHDKQNSGKSSFCRFLCPPHLKDYIAENLSVDKDSRILLTTNLIINLDELSTLSKVEINALKSLFSKDKINDRLPYDRRNSIIPRRASFIGSTNQTEFLNDESGSVRWLCFNIDSIDWSYREKVDINKVYAQAYHLFKSGWECDLTAEEIQENEEYNNQFQIKTSERELIEKYLEPGTQDYNDRFMTATEILLYLTERSENRIKLHTVYVGRALKLLGFNRETAGKERVHGYYIRYKIF